MPTTATHTDAEEVTCRDLPDHIGRMFTIGVWYEILDAKPNEHGEISVTVPDGRATLTMSLELDQHVKVTDLPADLLVREEMVARGSYLAPQPAADDDPVWRELADLYRVARSDRGTEKRFELAALARTRAAIASLHQG